jgi:hypothetical protein
MRLLLPILAAQVIRHSDMGFHYVLFLSESPRNRWLQCGLGLYREKFQIADQIHRPKIRSKLRGLRFLHHLLRGWVDQSNIFLFPNGFQKNRDVYGLGGIATIPGLEMIALTRLDRLQNEDIRHACRYGRTSAAC